MRTSVIRGKGYFITILKGRETNWTFLIVVIIDVAVVVTLVTIWSSCSTIAVTRLILCLAVRMCFFCLSGFNRNCFAFGKSVFYIFTLNRFCILPLEIIIVAVDDIIALFSFPLPND